MASNFLNFGQFFGNNSNSSNSKNTRKRTRSLRIEELEGRDLLSVTPWSLANGAFDQPYPSENTAVYESAPAQQVIMASAPAASISPVLNSGTLLVEGTNNTDWIVIEETGTQIIVHSFNATGTTQLNQWEFTKSTVSTIVFNGHDGNDTYKNFSAINDTLDGGNGNNLILGGKGTTTLINTGIGSNCFAINSNSVQWDSGGSLGSDDSLIFFTTVDRYGKTTGSFNSSNDISYVDWSTANIENVLRTVSSVYDSIGNYGYFRNNDVGSGEIYMMVSDSYGVLGSVYGYNSGGDMVYRENAVNSRLTIHEVGHNWDSVAENPYFAEFAAISYNGNSLKADAVDGDFAFGERGIGGASYEDWAYTISLVFDGYGTNNQNSSVVATAKYLQKVDIINQFGAWLGGSVAPNVPTITTQPVQAMYAHNGTAKALTIVATGNGILTYQWYKDDEIISGATSASYTPLTDTLGTAEYYCIVTNCLAGLCEAATSNTATITVDDPSVPKPATPSASVLTSDRYAEFWITDYDNTLTYKLYYSDVSGKKGADTGATLTTSWLNSRVTDVLRVTGLEPTSTTYYLLEAKNSSGGTALSEVLTATTVHALSVGDSLDLSGGKTLDDEAIDWNALLTNNRYIIVDFTASWCTYCDEDIDELKGYYNTYKSQGLEIISAYTMDTLSASKAKVAEKDVPWITITDAFLKISYRHYYAMNGIPTSVVIDCATGRIISKYFSDSYLASLDWTPVSRPDAPTNVEAIQVPGKTTISLSWTDSGDADSYEVYQCLANSGICDKVASSNITFSGTSATISDPINYVNEAKVYYKVVAIKDGVISEQSEVSNTVTITGIVSQLVAPTGVTATVKSATTVEIKWTAVPNATGYVIEYLKTGDDPVTGWQPQDVTGGTATFATVGNLTIDTEYQFRVIAKGNGTTFSDSPVSATRTVIMSTPFIIVTPGIVTDSSVINKQAVTVSGVKLDKKESKPTQTTLTFLWTPPKNAKSAELLDASALTFDLLAPKQKGETKAKCIATVSIDWADVYGLTVGGPAWTHTSGGYTVSITLKTKTVYMGYDIPTLEIKVSGLSAGTKYTMEMQAKYGTQYSKVTKVSATTLKYAAVKKDSKVKSTTIGQVTIKWNNADKDQPKAAAGKDTTYDVGFWIGSTAIFSQEDIDKMLDTTSKQKKDKDAAQAIWDKFGASLAAKTGTAKEATFYGVTQKMTFAVRANGWDGDEAVQSAVAKIAVTPLKYPAPATLKQEPGKMEFKWELPNFGKIPAPVVATTTNAWDIKSVTYTIGEYDTKKKEFTGTVTGFTLEEGLTGTASTPDILKNLTAGKTVAVVQVIEYVDGTTYKSVMSAVKTAKVK